MRRRPIRMRSVAVAVLACGALIGCSEGGEPAAPDPIAAAPADPMLDPIASAPVPAEPARKFEPQPLLPPPPAPPPGAFSLEAGLVATPVEVRLAEVLDTVWLDREFGQLEIGQAEQRRFTSGWYPPRPARQEAPAHVESRGRASIIELPIADVADRRLELDLVPLDGPDKLPNQVVRVVWNGFDLGRFVLPFKEKTLRVDVPERIQWLGLNRLRIEPLYWVSGASAGVSFDRRPTALQLKGLRLVGGSSAASSRPTGVTADGDRVLQGSGAIIAWHLLVPDDARLSAKLGWQGESAPGRGRLRLALTLESGEQVVLADHALADLASGDGVVLDVDLGRHAGELAGIQATVSAAAGEGAVVWDAPRIVGSRRDRTLDASAVRGDYDVLVLLFDTLRADYLSPYGNEIVKTPYLQSLADSGFTFHEAGANATWTRPSVASLWTGLHPWAHRVTGYKSLLPAGAPYLPEILSGAGWATVGVSNNAHFATDFGFGRGFDELSEYWEDRKAVLAEYPSAEAQAARLWGRHLAAAFDARPEAEPGRDQRKPVFAVVHEIDPHSPYQAPEPYTSLYDFGYEGNIDGWNVRDMHQGMRVLDVVNASQPWLAEADKRAMRAAYMAEVSFVDAYVGALLAHLESSGRRDRTLVVFVSDHGEQLFEHGVWGHGRSLYQEEIAVPLIFSLPGVIPAGLGSSLPVELVDVTPTILDLLGLEVPEGMQGRSLLPDMLAGPEAAAALSPQFAKSNTSFIGRNSPVASSLAWDSVRLGRWKLMRRNHRRMRVSQLEYELYDLERDPEEVLDLWGTRPVVGHALKHILEAKLARDERVDFEADAVEDMDPAVLENLRGLGYVE